MKRFSLAILLLTLIVLSSSAQTGCVSGNCENGFGVYKFSDGDIYEGTFLEGKKHGWGCYYYKDDGKSNQVHCGNWRFGEKHYFGAIFWKEQPDDSDFFLGMYKEGRRQEYGVYVYEDGTPNFMVEPVYYTKPRVTSSSRDQTGCISGDCQNGFGIYRYSDGDVYEGNFLNGKRHGWGRL